MSRWRSGHDEWIEGKHPALVDQETWDACARIRTRNRRSNATKRTRRSYPLTPVLRCLRCGGPMHGEASVKGTREDLYYACWDSRRTRSAARPGAALCSTRRIPLGRVEEAIRSELRRCALTGHVEDAYLEQLEDEITKVPDPRTAIEAAIRRLDDQLDRAKRLYEYGEYDWEVFMAKRAEIQEEQQRLRDQMVVRQEIADVDWCRAQVADLLATWEAADADQRTRLLASIFDHIEAAADPDTGLRLIRVPKHGWRPFFEYVVAQHHTWSCSNLSEVRGRVTELSRAALDALSS